MVIPVDPSCTWSLAALPIGDSTPVVEEPLVLELALALEALETLDALEPLVATEPVVVPEPVVALEVFPVVPPLAAAGSEPSSPQPTNAAPAASPDKNWRRLGWTCRLPGHGFVDLRAVIGHLQAEEHTASAAGSQPPSATASLRNDHFELAGGAATVPVLVTAVVALLELERNVAVATVGSQHTAR